MKKLISYLLILVMMLSLVPTFAYAAETVKEEKEPLRINEDREFHHGRIEVVIFNEFSNETLEESFGVDFFAGYIPEGIEIKEIELFNDYQINDNDFNAILILHIEPTTSEKIVDFVKTIYNHPKVKFAGMDYVVDICDPEETETETEAESESETVFDTAETVIDEITDNESTETDKAAQTVSEETVEAETEAVASVGNNNNKQTGDSLFIYVTLALLVSSVASTVVILKKGKKKEN